MVLYDVKFQLFGFYQVCGFAYLIGINDNYVNIFFLCKPYRLTAAASVITENGNKTARIFHHIFVALFHTGL